ncbi:MAG: hypothetical protein EOO20_12905 [Chryseobacterium sp.]|nr:MAG: hypothetical protein EOO20_12905 [Chryseobacterium sp.]
MATLLLLKNYNPLILLDTAYTIIQDDYSTPITIPGESLGEVYDYAQNHSDRSASVGDLIELNNELYLIMPLGYEKITWGDVVSFSPLN